MGYTEILRLFESGEPMVLLIGQFFDIEKHSKLLELPWSCIYASGYEDERIISVLNNSSRLCRKIYRVEDIKGKILDQKNLKVIELYSGSKEDWASSINRLMMKKNAERMLDKLPQLIQYIGQLVVVGYTKEDILELETFCTLLAGLRNNSIIYIGEVFDELLKEVLKEKSALQFDNMEYDFDADIDVQYVEETNHIINENSLYINGIVHLFDKMDFFSVKRFARILNLAEVMEHDIPSYLFQNYFYAFIKNSVYEPQWYGYKYGFNLERNFENELYEKVKSALEKPYMDSKKPLLVTGQTGCGKSVALANLAYKVFRDKNYPIIYINNMDIDFSPNIIFSKGKRDYKNSPQLIALDTLIHKFEEKDAKNILLIWDGSAYIRDREKYRSLYNTLKNKRGHNIVFVGSAYETQEEDDLYNQYFDKINANSVFCGEGEKSELAKLQVLLNEKAKLEREQINTICGLIEKDNKKYNNVMSLFYYLFYDVRVNLEKGVQREAEKSLTDVLERTQSLETFTSAIGELMIKAGFSLTNSDDISGSESQSVDIRKFLICVAICSQYSLSMPSRMAFSIINVQDSEVVQKILRIPFFEYIDEYENDYCIKVRTKLEAELLLKAYHITPEKEVEYVAEMIESIEDSDYYNQISEVSLITNLLYRMGPNSGDTSVLHKYDKLYLTIVKALKKVREEKRIINPSLGLQEITYMREYCLSNNIEIAEAERVSLLKEAISIGDELLGIFSRTDYDLPVRDALTIEVANSRYRLCLLDSIYIMKESTHALQDAMEVISRNPDNIYAYHAYLEIGILKYHNSQSDSDKITVLADMCDVVDRIREENGLISANKYFIEPADRIYSLLGKSENEKYFEELVKEKNYAGIYLKAKKMLEEAGIKDFREATYTKEQICVMEKVCEELLENEDYLEITAYSYQCQYLLLKIKWIIYNGVPMFHPSENRKFTRMTEEQWKNIQRISEHYILTFVNNNIVEPNNGYSVMYILALCYAQLNDFESCMKLVSKLRNDTEWFGYDNRSRIKHYLCDSEGKPLYFVGSFTIDTDPNEERGYVKIDKIKQEWNNYRNGLYFHKHNIRGIKIESGGTSNYFQLGLAYMGFSVYHGVNIKGDTKHA